MNPSAVASSVITILVVLFVLCGGDVREQSGACTPIQDVTRVVIHRAQGEDQVFTDPVHIRQLVEFANARLDVSQPRVYTMPAPQTTAAFYRNTEFVGVDRSRIKILLRELFPVERGPKGERAEIDEFKRLIRASSDLTHLRENAPRATASRAALGSLIATNRSLAYK